MTRSIRRPRRAGAAGAVCLAAALCGSLCAGLLPPTSAAAAERGEKKKGGGESFIQLPSLAASILRSGGGRAVLTVDVGVDVPDPKLRELANLSTPRLRDAYDQVMMLYAPSLPPGAPPDPDRIGRELQAATDRVLGRPGAVVLLGTILVN